MSEQINDTPVLLARDSKKEDKVILKLFEKGYIKIRWTLENAIPAIAFLTMFMVFLIQIFFRYVLKQSLFWTFEVTFIGYFWAIFLGAAAVTRSEDHVMFTMLYDKSSAKMKAISKIISNTLVLTALAISFVPTIEYIQFMHMDKTSVLRMPFSVVYSPILITIIMSAIHFVNDIIKSIKFLTTKESSK